jgi:hypothetical protein
MAVEGEFPKIDGDILYGSEINYFNTGHIQEVYTGSGFDSSQTTLATDTQSHELTAIIDTKGAGYVKIRVTAKAIGTSTATDDITRSVTGNIKAQIKEIGDAYADILVYQPIMSVTFNGTANETIVSTYDILHELTAGQKTNGFQIQIFSQSICASTAASTMDVTNVQTVIELA